MNSLRVSLALCLLLSTSLLSPTTLLADQRADSALVVERLSAAWLSDAQQVRTFDRLILYHGQAIGSYTADGKDWVGEVRGEVLILQPSIAEACSRIYLLPRTNAAGAGPDDIGFTSGPSKTMLFFDPLVTVRDGEVLSETETVTWHSLLAATSLNR